MGGLCKELSSPMFRFPSRRRASSGPGTLPTDLRVVWIKVARCGNSTEAEIRHGGPVGCGLRRMAGIRRVRLSWSKRQQGEVCGVMELSGRSGLGAEEGGGDSTGSLTRVYGRRRRLWLGDPSLVVRSIGWGDVRDVREVVGYRRGIAIRSRMVS